MSQKKSDLGNGCTIGITTVKVEGTQLPLHVYQTEIVNPKGISWREALATEELLRAFLRGLEAGAVMFTEQYIIRPEIPQADF